MKMVNVSKFLIAVGTITFGQTAAASSCHRLYKHLSVSGPIECRLGKDSVRISYITRTDGRKQFQFSFAGEGQETRTETYILQKRFHGPSADGFQICKNNAVIIEKAEGAAVLGQHHRLSFSAEGGGFHLSATRTTGIIRNRRRDSYNRKYIEYIVDDGYRESWNCPALHH